MSFTFRTRQKSLEGYHLLPGNAARGKGSVNHSKPNRIIASSLIGTAPV